MLTAAAWIPHSLLRTTGHPWHLPQLVKLHETFVIYSNPLIAIGTYIQQCTAGVFTVSPNNSKPITTAWYSLGLFYVLWKFTEIGFETEHPNPHLPILYTCHKYSLLNFPIGNLWLQMYYRCSIRMDWTEATAISGGHDHQDRREIRTNSKFQEELMMMGRKRKWGTYHKLRECSPVNVCFAMLVTFSFSWRPITWDQEMSQQHQ